jgi:hypothetical protein
MMDYFGIEDLLNFMVEGIDLQRAAVIEEACERMLVHPDKVGVFVDDSTGEVGLSRHLTPSKITYFNPPGGPQAHKYRIITGDTP